MSNNKQLVVGIVLMVIAMALLLTSGKGLWPYLGALIGLVAAFLIIRSILRTGLR